MGDAIAQVWPVSPLVSVAFPNIKRIHPLMQRHVESLISACKKERSIQRVFVFGSTVSGWCTDVSDIDVLVETDGSIPSLKLSNPEKFDIRYSPSLKRDSDLLSYVREVGVAVYG